MAARQLWLFLTDQDVQSLLAMLEAPEPAGPFAGWAQIDEERTDALVLRIPEERPDEIQPARLYAHTSYWRGGEKIRKRPVFSLWANQTLRWLGTQLPSTSVDFIRIGPDALDRAKAGTLRLTYLYRPLAPVKNAGEPVVAPPAGAIGEDAPDDEQ